MSEQQQAQGPPQHYLKCLPVYSRMVFMPRPEASGYFYISRLLEHQAGTGGAQ